MKEQKATKLIFDFLKEKTLVNRAISTHIEDGFKLLLNACKEIETNIKTEKKSDNSLFRLDCNDKSSNSIELVFGDDLLVFQKLPTIFQIDKNHRLWTGSYLSDNILNSYVGIINVYNFMNDSFRYNRYEDPGYLVARILINKENHFFVEGKRQLGFLYNDFPSAVISQQELKKIVESALLYCLDFDFPVPDYDNNSVISVGILKDQIDKTILSTTKRLGFKFYNDENTI